MDSIEATTFVQTLDDRRRAELAAAPAWEALLSNALDEGEKASGAFLPRAVFAQELAHGLNGHGATFVEWFAHLHAADFYLACACARGVAGAIARFQSTYGAEILRAATQFECASQSAEDLRQLLCQRLFLAHGDRSPKIAAFGGQGHLQNWLRVTMARTFVDATRGRSHTAEVPLEAALEPLLPALAPDPELEFLKQTASAQFKVAFSEAVAGLEPSFRQLLRLSVLERLTIDQLAALQGIHRATAARRVQKARDALLEATRAAMAHRLGINQAEVDSVMGLIQSRLDPSVERLLREP